MLGQIVYKKNDSGTECGNINEQIRLENTMPNSMYLVNAVHSGAGSKSIPCCD